MRWRTFVGVFVLLYQLTDSKPIKTKHKTQSTELVREKRGEVDGEEGSNEMQKFILDLSAKEDLRRLRERFKTKKTKDIDNDVEYRRLKRFSIHGMDDQEQESPSGSFTMEMRSSRKERTAKGDENRTSPDVSSFSEASDEPSLQHNQFYTHQGDLVKNKRSISILARALSKWKSSFRNITPADANNSGSGSTSESGEPDDEDEHEDDSGNGNQKELIPNDRVNSEIFDDISISENDKNAENPEIGHEPEGYFEDRGDSGSGENPAVGKSAGAPVNYHLAGGSWELIHHDPGSKTGSLPSLTSENTTTHSEYLQDDVVDDVDEYKRTEKSRRKPRLSKIRIVRSIEPQYEIQEISAMYSGRTDSLDDESAQVISVNNRPIKSDGYIGCFVDQHPNRDLIKAFSVNDLTPNSCRSVCKEKGHTYAGVQYGYLCHCGDSYGKYGNAAEEECNSGCRGDDEKKCGGFWRNSIYATDILGEDEEDNDRESRSQIDRIIPISESGQNEEIPVRQEITAFLRADIPEGPDEVSSVQKVGHSQDTEQHNSSNATQSGLKRSEVPPPTLQKNKPAGIDQIAYLHPQNTQRSFIPSNIVLRTLNPEPGKKTLTGVVKLKQNWHDDLKNKKGPKTLILAGNIESAFAEMFATDHDFEKAEVLGFKEASIRNDPSTVHKVLVEFALTFKKTGIRKDKKLREMVENSSRLDDMPVFGDTIEVQEYNDEKEHDFSGSGSGNSDKVLAKDTREVPGDNETNEDKLNGVDPFLEEVFRQI